MVQNVCTFVLAITQKLIAIELGKIVFKPHFGLVRMLPFN